MSYSINVSKNGRHYFATSEFSLQTKAEALRLYNDFLKLFPENESYEVLVSFINTGGKMVTREFKAITEQEVE